MTKGSKEYAAKAIEASIKRLGITPDAWLVHRVDKTMQVSLIRPSTLPPLILFHC